MEGSYIQVNFSVNMMDNAWSYAPREQPNRLTGLFFEF